MKIGAFSKKYNLSIDTIRYYMDIGLLTPIKKGGHYHFGVHTEEQGQIISDLKEMGFKLSEIKEMLIYKIFSKLDHASEKDFKLEMMLKKHHEIKNELERLSVTSKKIEKELELLKLSSLQVTQSGFPLEAMSIFQCSECQGNLSLDASQIISNEVFEGRLLCKCGFEIQIEEGVLSTSSSYSSEDVITHDDLMTYINQTPAHYMLESNKALDWLVESYASKGHIEKIVLDVGTGIGLFVRGLLNVESEDGLLICNDIDKSTLLFLKKILQHHKKKMSIVYLACNLKHLPIKMKCIDILSAVGTSTSVTTSKETLMSHVHKHMKDRSELYVLETVYDKVDPSNSFVYARKDAFKKERIEADYESYAYKDKKTYTSDAITNGGPYEPFSQNKDEMYFYAINYKR